MVSGARGKLFTLEILQDLKITLKPFNTTMSVVHQLPLLYLTSVPIKDSFESGEEQSLVISVGFDRVFSLWEVSRYQNFINCENILSLHTGGNVLESFSSFDTCAEQVYLAQI